jgi:hypothetical protein
MVRDGKISDSTWGDRMRGTGAYADYVQNVFDVSCRRYGLNLKSEKKLSTKHFRRAGSMSLFD